MIVSSLDWDFVVEINENRISGGGRGSSIYLVKRGGVVHQYKMVKLISCTRRIHRDRTHWRSLLINMEFCLKYV